MHTVSFSRSCDILANYYSAFTEEFAVKCKKLAQIRNGFIHHSTTINNMELVTFLYIYQKSIDIYYKEIDERPFDFEMYRVKQDHKSNYKYDIDTFLSIQKIYQILFKDFINNIMFLHIIGFVVDTYNRDLIEVNLTDYDKIEKLFFKHNSQYYKKNELQKWHQEFKDIYKIMIDSNIIYENYDFYYDKLQTLWIAEWVLKEIMENWDELEQMERLKCNKSINQIFREWENTYKEE